MAAPEQTAGSGDLQPGPLPHIRQSTADDGTTDHVHRSCSNAPEKNKGKMSGSVLDQIADIFKGGKGKGDDHGSISDLLRVQAQIQEDKRAAAGASSLPPPPERSPQWRQALSAP